MTRRQQARAARALIELALDATGWKFDCVLSRWIDALVVVEEEAA